jgi:hypothetical protein
MEMHCVFCDAGSAFLNVVQMNLRLASVFSFSPEISSRWSLAQAWESSDHRLYQNVGCRKGET